MSIEQDQYDAAVSRVEARMGLLLHATVFAAVNLGLVLALGFEPAAGYLWGWGIGLGAHVFYVLGPLPGMKQRWIERELARSGR